MTLRRFLAVTHEATLTGAPMNLLHLVRWIVDNTEVEVHTLVLRDGPLRSRFEAVGPVTVIDDAGPWAALRVAQDGLVRLGSRRAWRPIAATRLVPQLRHLSDFDVAYFNSVTSIGVQPYLPPSPLVVNHVHELHVAIRAWQPAHDFELFRTRPDAWVAASGAVRDLLLGEVGVDPSKVRLHHEFIDARSIAARRFDARAVERLRRSWGVPDDGTVVMGAGTLDWRKGPDLFVQLATEVRRRSDEPVSFVWVGGERSGLDWERLRSDLDRAGADHVRVLGTTPDPMPWFAAADVFALTSREDPFPLVCLEHGALGHPVVTYRNGGIHEFLDEAGPHAARGVVDHLDVGAMADHVIELIRSEELRRAAGAELRDRVLAHHDVTVAAPRLLADLEQLLAQQR